MTDVLINPQAAELGRRNAILNARGMGHHEARFAGALSIKTVLRGRATWETAGGRFDLVPGSLLVLNDGEEYTITTDALQPVETFCLFFARGFVEDAFRAETEGSAGLIEEPEQTRKIEFFERLHFESPLMREIETARECLKKDRQDCLSSTFYEAALALVREQVDVAKRAGRLPSLRAATRAEIVRRLGVATSYLHASSDRGVTIAEAAREACLSPFHFHRLFTRFHGVTPHRYLNRLRLERARALLRASDRSVIDVATECGFESLGSFTTLYKRTFGVSPGAAKKQESRIGGDRDGATMRP